MSTSTVPRPHARIVPLTRPMPTQIRSARPPPVRRTTTDRPGRSAAGPPRPPCQIAVSSLIAMRVSAPRAPASATTSRCGLASSTMPLTPGAERAASRPSGAANSARRCAARRRWVVGIAALRH
ncbi:hypothetical protein ACFQY7_40750 [Actinomadura luteofluorescens]|uniref:hypothetical protein n=1 Tax=Actinomadura luteofluorescens TaxID=46163 RepID=UPI00362C3C39